MRFLGLLLALFSIVLVGCASEEVTPSPQPTAAEVEVESEVAPVNDATTQPRFLNSFADW